MKSNIHFNHYQYQGEQELVQDLHDEIIQILGVNMSYMPKEHFDYDLIMGSDDDQRFSKAYLIEMMMEQTDDYVGNTLLGKFGLQVEETMTLLVSKRRFDEAVANLGELELENSLTNQEVLQVIQRGELLTRLASQVRLEAEKLGTEAGLITIQIDSLESGVTSTLNLVLKDHLPGRKFRVTAKVLDEIANLSYQELNTIDYLGSILSKLPLDDISVPRGYRVLARLPDLPDNLHDSIVQKYKSLPKLLSAPTEKLYEIEGIGRNRAQQLRDYFDTLLKNVGFSYINGH